MLAYKRGFSRHAVSVVYDVCPCVYVSVCLSVTLVHSVKTGNYIFNFFHSRVAKPF